ncbi:MAG: 50S ribosomal protein L31 [Candidatus Omnitrophica bacterium]|nr:50S ribosomal protein L31 [Candidatus Omnitrophota bacterium]
MKKGIHPEYKEATIVCACGNIVKTRSTKPEIKIEICNKCHPYFTGKQKYVDSAGRVEKFKKKYGG